MRSVALLTCLVASLPLAGGCGTLKAAGPRDARGPAPFVARVSGSGPPMILIPGLANGGNVWDGTVAHFQGRYECHVVTLAGFAGQPAIGEPFLEKVRDG